MKLLHDLSPYEATEDQQRVINGLLQPNYGYSQILALPDGSIQFIWQNGTRVQVMTAQAVQNEIEYMDQQDENQDIECEHEDYDAEGFCTQCDYYNEDMNLNNDIEPE